MPDSWVWIKEVFEEAHLPRLGLPALWRRKTEGDHILTAYDPDGSAINPGGEDKWKKLKSSPVGFLTATRGGKHVMPGTKTPASARFELYSDKRFQDALVRGADGEILAPCLVHGDYVKVEALQSDHLQAKNEIIKRQKQLVNKLNKEPGFAKYVMQLPGANKFFIQKANKRGEKKIYGTLYFYELYFNDIDNLWLICSACNHHKSDADVIKWLKDQWLYGPEFLEYIGSNNNNKHILRKTKSKQGLAKAAIEWYWQRHASYAVTAKRLLEDVIVPIKILGKKIEVINGSGHRKKIERVDRNLAFRMALIKKVLHARIGRGRPASETGSESSGGLALTDSSGNDIIVPQEVWDAAVEEVIDGFDGLLRGALKSKIDEMGHGRTGPVTLARLDSELDDGVFEGELDDVLAFWDQDYDGGKSPAP